MQQQTPVADYPSRSSSNAALDPTGMFRDQGRRVIAPSSGGVPVQKNECTTPISSSSSYATHSKDGRGGSISPNDRVGHIVDGFHINNDVPEPSQQTTLYAKSKEQSLIMLSGLQNIDARNDTKAPTPALLTSFRREDDVQPEIDHPPQQQSISLMNLSDSVNYSIQSSQHNDERLDNNCHNNNINRSNIMNNNSEHEHLSTVSSTASIMKSVIENHNEYSSLTTYEDVNLLAVKRRMMQNVEEEVADKQHGNKASSYDNASLECHADNNDSFRSDDDNSTIIKESNTLLFQCEVVHDIDIDQLNVSNAIMVADFSSDSTDVTKCRGASPNNTEQKSSLPQLLEFRRGTSVMSAPSEAFLVENPFRRQNNDMPSTPSDSFLNEPYAFLRKRSSERLKRLSPTKFQLSAASSNAIDKAVTTAGLLPQLARQCFSFEDTAVNDGTFLAPMPDLLSGIDENDDQVVKEGDYLLDYRPAFGTTKQCHEPSHRKSQTWSESLPKASSFDAWSPARGGVKKSLMEETDTIIKSYKGEQRKYKNIEDWKKLEMEHGDAINLLACIVEYLSSFEHEESGLESKKLNLVAKSMKDISAAVDDISVEPNDEKSITLNHQMRSDVIDTLLRSHEFALEAKRSSQSANKWLQSIGWTKAFLANNQQAKSNGVENVALRARLNAAENSLACKQDEISRLNEEISNCHTEIGRLRSSTFQSQEQPLSLSMNQSILSNSSSDTDSFDNIMKGADPLVLGPTIKLCPSPSQDESFLKWERDIELQMNLESRKEVLLLKAALERANRKIAALEHEKIPFLSDIEPIHAASEDELFMKIAADIEGDAMCSPLSGGDEVSEIDAVEVTPAIKLDDPALKKELEEYRQALLVSIEHERNRTLANSVMSTDDPNLAEDLSKSQSSEKMISVRMIDGENFTTDWSDLVDLPPPPDHELHSPIVDAVLKQWSDDDTTRTSLILWLEDILVGSKSVQSVPSLKLCGLDHQTRDGFVMHVLPLLLRRKDVHVHLTSRVHRRTTYDMAISVTPTSFGLPKNDRLSDSSSDDVESRHGHLSSKRHLMAFQATQNGAYMKKNDDIPRSPNRLMPFLAKPFLGRSVPDLVRSYSNAGSISTAVTTPVSNRTPTRTPLTARVIDGYTSFPRRDAENASLMDDLSVVSSAYDPEKKESQPQSGLIGSMLGRLSGKKSIENEYLEATPSIGRSHTDLYRTPKNESIVDEEETPYHRIVSAPPGKIGISFVEYRGHAMVSSVSDESPLVGWVFPSDVLVAIDDVPVSGLHTREIVKLLTNKIKQQRNLRMVSAVSMNEFTPGTI